jgi:hypothetical protein
MYSIVTFFNHNLCSCRHIGLLKCWPDIFFFFICFWRTSGSFFMIFSSVAPHRGQPPAKCHPRWQPIRRLAVSCGLGRHWIRTQDCRTTVWCATIEPPCLPYWATMPPKLSHHASLTRYIWQWQQRNLPVLVWWKVAALAIFLLHLGFSHWN